MGSIKQLVLRLRNALVNAINALTEYSYINQDGDLHLQEPLVRRAGDKTAAIVLAVGAMLLLYLPSGSAIFVLMSDQLLRTATELWKGLP